MASFSAEMRVAGQNFLLTHCSYETTQLTDGRGRVTSKVRRGLVELALDVPDGDFLLAWASDPHQRYPVSIVFRDAAGGQTLETLAMAAAYCVGYREVFSSGDLTTGAYQCQVTLADPGGWTWQPGEPAALRQAFQQTPLVLTPGPPVPVVPPVELPQVEVPLPGIGVVARLLALLPELGAATALAVLVPTNSGDDPGYQSEWDYIRRHTPPTDKDRAELADLEQRHQNGSLTPEEERHLLALLARVRGLHLQKLAELRNVSPDFVGQVPMEESDLGRMALAFRKVKPDNNWHPGNVAVFEYADANGKLTHLIQETNAGITKKHAERLGLEELQRRGVPIANVTRIYSELEPCEVDSGGINGEGCKEMLSRHYPNARITYSYEYKGRYRDTKPGRTASLERRDADFSKYKH